MNSVTYVISTRDVTLTEGEGIDLLLRDAPRSTDALRLQAMVASGDLFETFAARLEQVADAVPATSVEQHQLQDIIGQLIYLQRYYAITKKS